MGKVLQDLRYGIRQLRKHPGYTLAAVLTLALGIGANTAVFSVANAVLIKSLPYQDADRLDLIRINIGTRRMAASVSAPELVAFRENSRLYENWAGFYPGSTVVRIKEDSFRIRFGLTSANLFSLLGYEPMLGRGFQADEETKSGPKSIIISHSLWQSRYGGDRKALGETIDLIGQPYAIVGVLPPEFKVHIKRSVGVMVTPDLWAPLTDWQLNRHWLRVISKRKPGVSVEQGQAEIDSITAGINQGYDRNNQVSFTAVPLQEDLVGSARPALVLLFFTVAFVLLITCANVAGMALARSGARSDEVAIRAAMGAGRGRILRQLLTEGALLSIAGGVLGLVFAGVGLAYLLSLRPAHLPRLDAVTIDGSVLTFTFCASIATVFLFGLLPAWRLSRLGISGSLKGLGRQSLGRARGRMQSGIVVVEVGASVLLLIGVGLMLQSFDRMRKVDLGFDASDSIAFRVDLPITKYPLEAPEKKAVFYQQLRERMKRIPGVEESGATTILPLAGGFFSGSYAFDADSEKNFGNHMAEFRVATPGFLETIGARLASGRFFLDEDGLQMRKVVIVDETLARSAWPGQSPVGKKIKAGYTEPEWLEVIGVIEHVRAEDVRAVGRPQVYFPNEPGFGGARVVIRSSSPVAELATAVRDEIRLFEPGVAVSEVRTLRSYVDDAMADIRFLMVVVGAFSVLSLLLVSVGIYGTMSFWVDQRVQGIGVRLALGAGARDILGMVMLRGIAITLAGVVLGLAAGSWLTRFLASYLYGVSPIDLATFAATSLLILALSAAACYLPARRATGVDPVTTLRYE